MAQTILIIIGVAIITLLIFRRTREPIVGICAAAIGQDARKRENKEKILTFLRERSASAKATADRGSFSNADIREALKVSDRSVIRYMDELEREGKVDQVGNTGRGVLYRLK